jgi:TolB-like protein
MRLLVSVLCFVVLSGGCVYSFTGGGLPRHIRTIAVMPFDNETPQPLVESEVETRMQEELPRNLGVRLAAEAAADAVIRGRIVSYDEVTASFQPTQTADGTIPVAQRQVRITYEAEIYDMREDRSLWRAQSQSVTGNFQPETESPEEGRARAVQELVRRVIEGAQSQW